MLKWRYEAGSPALRSATGFRDGDRLVVERSGRAIEGPGIDVPAGRITARVILEGASGEATISLVCDAGNRLLAQRLVDLDEGDIVELASDLQTPVSDLEVRLDGKLKATIVRLEIDLEQTSIEDLRPDRAVGYESSKSFARKIESGFWKTFLGGPAILELGYKGYYGATVPIVPQAVGLDLGYPGYDGTTLPFADESVDGIYNSHCLEHIPDYLASIRDWYRVLKFGGYLVIVVPHVHLFEKRIVMPSLANMDHRRFYTSESLLREIGEALPENSYRIRHLRENDEGFDYSIPPRVPGGGQFEIEVVVEKLRKPNWNSDDNTVRPYSSGEFYSEDARRPNAWTIEVDLQKTDRCVFYGPYANLRPARYVADFHFTLIDIASLDETTLCLDVACDATRICAVDLTGPDGLEKLRSGVVSIPFEISRAGTIEFRMYSSGRPVDGTARFRGVQLRYS